jgi:outer membrane protein OmpA-like peptidoglycan-associated protein
MASALAIVVAGAASAAIATSASAAAKSHDTSTAYSVGTPSSAQPSGQAPPTSSDIPGYQLSYVTNFPGSSVPAGWEIYTGKPSGDPGSQWARNHVTVSGNMLQLNTFQDPNFNNEWVTGGVCQCRTSHTYGAFFVRSRMTGAGPTQVAILWPTVGWPPEIDFDETYGGVSSSQATVHYTSSNLEIHNNININMTAWHTWGVIWTPTSITYTVDGNVWGTVTDTSAIPNQPMTLTLQQQTWCSSGFACPTSPQSTDVNWVAEYTPSSGSVTTSTSPPTTTTTTVKNSSTSTGATNSVSRGGIALGSFKNNSVDLTPAMQVRARHLARVIVGRDDSSVTLTGYASNVANRAVALALSRARANNVKRYLEAQLASFNDRNVAVIAVGASDSDTSTSVHARVDSGNVVALLK